MPLPRWGLPHAPHHPGGRIRPTLAPVARGNGADREHTGQLGIRTGDFDGFDRPPAGGTLRIEPFRPGAI